MSATQKPALRFLILAALAASSLATLEAQVQVRGHLHPSALAGVDRGRLAPETRLGVVTVFFKKTARQQAELEKLLDRQQDSSSPDYHRWLTPEQYADRFGASPDDAAAMASWLAPLSAVSLLACYIPARRASRIDPTVALRED